MREGVIAQALRRSPRGAAPGPVSSGVSRHCSTRLEFLVDKNLEMVDLFTSHIGKIAKEFLCQRNGKFAEECHGNYGGVCIVGATHPREKGYEADSEILGCSVAEH